MDEFTFSRISCFWVQWQTMKVMSYVGHFRHSIGIPGSRFIIPCVNSNPTQDCGDIRILIEAFSSIFASLISALSVECDHASINRAIQIIMCIGEYRDFPVGFV